MNSKLHLYALVIGLGFLLNARAYDESLFTTNTLFIEAEDADFSHGQFVSGQKIGMDGPYPGGAYKGLGTAADLDFDWHAEGPNGQAYRPATGISGGKENGSAGNNRGTFTVTDWWTLGWNNGGDWYNYTRVFPSTPRDYFVYGHLASGGNPINIQVDQITSGVGQTDSQQVKTLLGYFAPGRATAGWDSLEVFPLTDASGNVITVRLSGQTTLRTTVLPNSNSDQDYYAFVPVLPPQITQQPTNATVIEGDTASFSIQLVQAAGVSFQWLRNGSNIPGATNSSYTIAPVSLSDSKSQFQCFASDSAGGTNSASATLTVLPDTTPPALVRAFNIGTTSLSVIFSEPVDPTSATNPLNYSLSGGVSISSAVFGSDTQTILLTTAAMTYGVVYTLTVNNVRDLAFSPNTIAPNSQLPFTATAFAPQSVGSPTLGGFVTPVINGYDVGGSGSDIGGTNDQFQIGYQTRTGDFDMAVRLNSFAQTDAFAQAGLMAREDLTSSARFAAVFATPSMNGVYFETRVAVGVSTTSSGNLRVNYPYTWLRLQRVGNLFTGYASYDGITWQPLGSSSFVVTNALYVGMAVCSHNPSQVALAQFRDFTTVTNAVISAVSVPHELLGPSSRNTGIVFSEIMYKPAPRSDGNNVEFLELYNSCPFFQDISGYQVTCADMNFTFPPNTIIPGGAFFVLAASPQGIANVYGLTSNVYGPYTGNLKKSETLELLDEQSNVLLTVPYTDVYPWPVAAAGTGHSIVLANPSYGEGDPRAWDISDAVGGSPGQPDPFRPSPLRNVVINEILPHSENPAVPQFIELYNHGLLTNNLAGCILTDDPSTNKFVIPAGTLITPGGFASFDQTQLGFTMNPAGGTVYLIKPDGSRVLDAVQFEPQADGVSYGRWPDGANDFYNFTTNTPGVHNGSIVIGDVVINELMYDPISGNDDDQYIEIYNQGTNTINLSGWKFTAGVTFTFPPNVTLASNGYLVVARNLTNLLTKYPNLNATNTVGNYTGRLSHNGKRVALAMPQNLYGTSTIYVVEDEVTYGTGGRWGEWSAGGGSSLELIDPRANHHLAANWADSDDTQKSSWVNIETTGVLDNGANYDPSIDYAQIGTLDAGECLVDNIEVDQNGTNYVSNGTFENGLGLTGWSIQGSHACSSLENSGYQSSYSLHIRNSDRIWTGNNSCEVALKPNSMAAGQTATLRFKARWLHGWPEALLRLNGNWLEATAAMPVPSNLGSPGAPNSRYTTNAGPAMYNVTHTPSVPAANQPVVVTAMVHDPDGVQNLTLYYRTDPATAYTAVPMNDKGTGGDVVAGDGVYSAIIPGHAANQIVAFYISATDNLGAATRFPVLRTNDNAPVPECAVMFGDGNPGGSFAVCHLWITQTNVNRWGNLGNLSRDWNNECTFVTDSRVIYNVGGRFSGSPYHQIFTTPVGNVCSYEWKFKDDDRYLGVTSYKKLHPPGGNPGTDLTLQGSQVAFSFQRTVGQSWLYKRYIALFVNGNRRNTTLIEDTQVPDSDVVKEHFPNDVDGFLYKMQPWFEMAPFLSGETMGFNNESWCTIMPYTTTGGVKKRARYRWNFEMRRTPDSNSNYTNVFALVDAANSSGSPNYVANMESMANMENWMRVFAAFHAAGDWDSFGSPNSQNLYGYIGTQGTKYTLVMWELETVFGNNSGWAPGQGLLSVNGQDSNMQNIYNNPTFLRMYWRAMQELVNGPLNTANSGPLIMAKYNAFIANGLNVENPTLNLEPWLTQARSSIGSQLAAVNAATFSVNPTVTLDNNAAYVTGQAPVNVAAIQINGAAYPVTWTSLTTWHVTIPLIGGTNNVSIVGVDRNGQPLAGTSNHLALVYSGTIPSPVGYVAINEIMYNPLVPGAQYVELYNNSPTVTFDLSGWQLQGVAYTFASGASIGPNSFLVLVANRSAFSDAYGGKIPIFDAFNGTLSTSGQTLLLVQPGTNSTPDLVVAGVRFGSAAPWPAGANGLGSSLQLIDAHQDNWREGNWAGNFPPATFSPGTINQVATSLPAFPPLWLNEVQADNLTGITNGAGQRVPWLELFNPTTNAVSLNGIYLSTNYASLNEWAFPTNATINPGEFKVIFADAQTSLSTAGELHTSFTLSRGSGSLALSRLYNGQSQVLDYIDYTNISPDHSYGSLPDGQSFDRQEFAIATPGGTNNPSVVPTFIPYSTAGAVYTQNFDGLPDPGATSVNSANPVTINGVTYTLADPFGFADPVVSSGGGLNIAELAGWYGRASLVDKFGATDGDQTTGGQISFGLPNSANRALGLLATSSTGATAFGARFRNQSGQSLNSISVQLTGEVWRQSNLPKTLACYYFIDPTGTAPFPSSQTASLSSLDVSFAVDAAAVGGLAVDGTSSVNQAHLSAVNQTIADWPPGAALWLVWQMTDPTGKAQGLAIDNLSFSASGVTTPLPLPLNFQTTTTNLILSWTGVAGQTYQVQYKDDLSAAAWTPLGSPLPGTGVVLSLTNDFTQSSQRFYRLEILP